MRIVVIIDTLRSGGKERRLVELIKGLYRNHPITFELVLLSRIIHYQEILDLGIKIHFLERKWDKDPFIFFKFYRICKQFNPHIIQSWESMSSIYAAPVARLLGVKFVNAMIYDAPNPFKRWSRKWTRSRITFPLSHAIVGNSQCGLDTYNAPKSKSYLIYNGYDFERLEHLEPAGEVRSRFHITTPYVVGMVATFSHHKDHKTFIIAAQSILANRSDVSFICVGGAKDHYRQELEVLIHPQNKDRIIIAGAQNPIEPIVNIFNIGVLSTYTEGISNAIMEYMALAKPVVATDGGGTKELVLHGKTGYLVGQRSPGELQERINFLLDNPEIALEMGRAGKRRIEETFNLSLMTLRFHEIYNHLIS